MGTKVVQKGRSSKPALNRVARHLAVLTLGYRQLFFARWVSTQINPADEPSRVFASVDRPEETGSPEKYPPGGARPGARARG